MTQNTVPGQGPHVMEPKRSGARKWLIGCGIGCLVLIIILIVAGYFGFKAGMKMVNQMTKEFEDQGFKKVMGQQINVSGQVTEKTLYVGQVVKMTGTCTTDMAIFAQMAEIDGKIDGTLYFRGQVLTIGPKAEIMKDLDLWAQMATVNGTVHGKILGTYQTSTGKGLKPPSVTTRP